MKSYSTPQELVRSKLRQGHAAKLAHDLRSKPSRWKPAELLRCRPPAERERQGELTLRVPIADLKVHGVRKGGTVDTSVLSGSDRAEIERKLKSEG